MEDVERNIVNVHRELEKANAKVIRLSRYIADVNHEKEKCDKLANDKIVRLKANLKVLEEQYDLVVSDKFEATKRLSEVETKCENYERELEELKEQNRKQQISISVSQQEIDAFNDEKKKIRAKFDSFKSKAKIVDEQIMEFLKKDSFRTDTAGDLVECKDEQVPPSSSVASTNVDVADLNNDRELRSRTHVSSYIHVSMRKTSGTTVKRSASTTTIEMTKTKSVKSRKLIERKCPSEVATEQKTDVQLSSNQIVERPKRFIRCTFCLRPYRSTPEKAFCGCQYIELNN